MRCSMLIHGQWRDSGVEFSPDALGAVISALQRFFRGSTIYLKFDGEEGYRVIKE